MKKVIVLLVSMFMFCGAQAASVGEWYVSGLIPTQPGVNASYGAFFHVTNGSTDAISQCAASVIWIPFDASGFGKAAYATVLAGVTGNRALTYLAYYKDSNGNCYLIQAQI